MKKVLKVLGLLLLTMVAIILIGGLFADKKYHYQKSIEIAAPQETVWNNVSTLKAMTKWMPWMRMDPNMKTTFTGRDGTVGAQYTWSGNDKVGKGSMRINKVQAPKIIGQDLVFSGPWDSKAYTDIILDPIATGTKVTWTMDSEMPYPFNFVSKLFFSMDDMMDKDFGAGLNNLKQMSEL